MKIINLKSFEKVREIFSFRKEEAGNVLFLILIAVALFAALSYAVTQSSRSGGGDAGKETSLINSAQITQYPAGLRTAIIRMMVSEGVQVDQLEFNPPSDLDDCSGGGKNCVFHSNGGGATYVMAPEDVLTGSGSGEWIINGENEINYIGSDGSANDTFASSNADIIAFLPDVTTSVCQRINDELSVNGGAIPPETGIDFDTLMDDENGMCDGGCNGGTIGFDETSLDGQAFGCFSQSDRNVYFHVLIER